jgi:hypothetical protein
MNRRLIMSWLGLTGLLSACSFSKEQRTSPQIIFEKALVGLQNVQTIDDLKELLGPPKAEGSGRFDDSNDTNLFKYATRETWLRQNKFVPSDLPERLRQAQMFTYTFSESGGKHAGGTLEVYFDLSGQRLGWSYSPALDGLVAFLNDVNSQR